MKKDNIIIDAIIIVAAIMSSLFASYAIVRYYTKDLKTNVFEKDVNLFLFNDTRPPQSYANKPSKNLNQPQKFLV